MPIIKEKEWNECVAKNDDPYGGCAVNVAREVMRLLDEEKGDFDAQNLVHRANDTLKAGITGFMAGCVASMVSKFHSRGEEFRRKWNKDYQIGDEGEKANESGGVLNPALLTIESPEEE